MLVSLWSVKGGSGTTVVAAALALVVARSSPDDVLLVDLAGDVPTVLGLPEPPGPGVTDWLAAGPDVPVDGWARLEVAAPDGLRVIPRGAGPFSRSDRIDVLVELLGRDARAVIVDCGLLGQPGASPPDELARAVAARSTQSVLHVTRACYPGLRRAVLAPLQPSGVVLVTEAGRSLGAADVAALLGVPVIAEVDHDPAVARAVDSGLLASRLPRGLERVLRSAA